MAADEVNDRASVRRSMGVMAFPCVEDRLEGPTQPFVFLLHPGAVLGPRHRHIGFAGEFEPVTEAPVGVQHESVCGNELAFAPESIREKGQFAQFVVAPVQPDVEARVFVGRFLWHDDAVRLN